MSFLEDVIDPFDISGRRAAGATEDAAAAQRDAIDRAIAAQQEGAAQGQEFLSPFAGLGQRGVELSGFLGDPNAQFDFLQSNPLFQLALENANQQTLQGAAAGGRLAAGDTLQQLSNNVLLSAQPLIDRQRQDIGNLINVGTGIAQSQANTALGLGSNVSNLLTDIGNVDAAEIAGVQGARQQGLNNLLQIGGTLAGFSDPKLKKDAKIVGKKGKYDIYTWTWNALAGEKFGLKGESIGVMFPDVLKLNPEATSYQDGFGKVNYTMIGL